MNYLVMGCNGMVGHVVSLFLKEKGHEVIGFAKKESDLNKTIIGDALDTDSVRKVIKGGHFDFVVNCIGILNDEAENNKASAVLLNSYFPHFLAEIVREMNTKIIHVSTDCVFSGDRGSYREDDLKDGLTFYDRSKALGELEDDRNITLRTSIVGPDRNANGIGLLNWFMKHPQDAVIKGYSRAIWTGVTSLEFAKIVEFFSLNDYSGLYNVVPRRQVSKHDLLCMFNEEFCDKKRVIISDDTVVLDKSLVCSEFDYDIPDYVQMIRELAEWMKDHSSVYPSYYTSMLC